MSTDRLDSPALAFHAHDHRGCISQAIAVVEEVCAKRRLRLTPLRQRVLEILLEDHNALGAYEILARLQAEGLGAHPPVAYRALDFLVKNGFAHKVERLNAFVACCHPEDGHSPAFLICRSCRSVAETHVTLSESGLGLSADKLGFQIEFAVLEIEGLCPACRADTKTSA